MKRNKSKLWCADIRHAPWPGFSLVFGLILVGNWASTTILELMRSGTGLVAGLVAVFVLSGAFLIGTCVLWIYRHRFYPYKVVYEINECRPRKALIVLLSKSNHPLSDIPDVAPQLLSDNDITLSYESLVADAQHVAELKATTAIGSGRSQYWNWEQMMRGVGGQHEHQQRQLKEVHLIGSCGTAGSFGELEQAKEFLGRYFPADSGVTVALHETCVNFENFGQTSEAIRTVVDDIKTRSMKDRDIAIDVTGGFKIVSIAGAAVTFQNNDLLMQYVTNGGGVKTYNIEIAAREDS
jgi:hypothetical protein